ncbi:DUF302 domain-containing protein [Amycolatopsis sp. NPDC051903]|uniref:DUF302 domain-containing protein n=1 Tax=Amycolatopsis sp. NPDC051903 TaxID=3363936 RepID=UPI003790E244
MITQYTVENYEYVTDKTYEEVVAAFDAVLGDVEYGRFTEILKAAETREEWERAVTEVLGTSGMLRFFTVDHGKWMGFYGHAVKAKKYVYGNPLIAETMMRHDTRFGQQAPNRLQVYEDADGHARVSYDLPSSIFGFIGNEELTRTAYGLDAKVAEFVERITGTTANAR